jgi:ferric-chelate reductase
MSAAVPVIPSTTTTNTTGSSSAAAGSGTNTTNKSPKMDVNTFIFHINLILFCFFALFVLWRAVGTVARFSQTYEWGRGLILRRKEVKTVYKNRPEVFANQTSWFSSTTEVGHSTDDIKTNNDEKFAGSDESHTYVSHSQPDAAKLGKEEVYQHARYANYPPRMPSSIFRFMYPCVSAMRTRVNDGMTLGQALILALYAVLVAYAAFYKSNPFTDPKRAGWVAISQIPVVVTLGTKNNLVGMLLSVGYEKINFIHRFAGRAVFFAVNVHGLGYMYKWLVLGTFSENFSKPSNMYGFTTLIAVDILALFSVSYIRRKFHGFFVFSHLVGIFTLFFAAYMHKTAMRPYILAAIGVYSFDRLLRLLKTRITTATLRPLPEMNTTRIEIPSLNAGWRAGQHVRIKVVSSGMGVLGWMQTHPFTIASVGVLDGARGGEEGLVLMAKNVGDWTGDLMRMAKKGSYESGNLGRDVKVIVEGPYGGPGNTVFSSFSSALFVAGGSGISFALSSIQELLQRESQGRSRVKSIDLLWIAQDISTAAPLLPLFTALAQSSYTVPLRVTIHYTRASAKKTSGAVEGFYHPSVSILPGRPNMDKVIDGGVSNALAMGHTKNEPCDKGMIVGVCGPAGLADKVAAAVDRMDGEKKRRVGGVEVFEEFFSL